MSKLIRPFLILVFIAINHCTYAQRDINYITNPGSLDSLINELNKEIKIEKIPGLLVSIVTRDSILYSGGLGFADLEHKEPVNSQTLFHVYSITKMFTALAIQKLISEGKINLDDELKIIAPEVRFKNAWEKTDPVRVVNLLEHTAGFDDVHLNRMINPTGKLQGGLDAVNYVQQSLISRWRPGEIHAYSNPGYVVLGYLIEKISGKSLTSYITQNILRPLQMQRSEFDTVAEGGENRSIGYINNNGTLKKVSYRVLGGNGADGSLMTNADDMSIFLKALLNNWQNGNIQFLPEGYLKEMETIHSTLAAKSGLKAGYGLANELEPNYDNIPFRGHGGEGEGFSSTLLYNREYGFGFVLSSNGGTLSQKLFKLVADYLAGDIPRQTPLATPLHIDALIQVSGYYQLINFHGKQWGFREKFLNCLTLELIEDKLVVHYNSSITDTLYPSGSNLFYRKGAVISGFAIGRNKDGCSYFYGDGNYYQKTAYIPVLIQKVLWYLSVFAILLSVIVGIVSIFLFALKKLKVSVLYLTIIPAFGGISGIVAYLNLILADSKDRLLYTSINSTTLVIFGGSLAFGLCSFAGIWLLYKYWNRLESCFVKLVLTFNMIFLTYFSGLLLIHGWIGVRIWNL